MLHRNIWGRSTECSDAYWAMTCVLDSCSFVIGLSCHYISLYFSQAIEEYGNKTVNVFVLSMDEYLEKFWQFFIPGVMELYKSITEVLGNKTKGI